MAYSMIISARCGFPKPDARIPGARRVAASKPGFPIFVSAASWEVWGSKSPSEALQPPPDYDRKPSREHIGAGMVPISTRVLSQVTAACPVFIASRASWSHHSIQRQHHPKASLHRRRPFIESHGGGAHSVRQSRGRRCLWPKPARTTDRLAEVRPSRPAAAA